ncbi:hypothetical protein CKAH01_08668 [Colletotrichum kahawae]|uniref:Uncharacterized protein n=1 Tax=Colletotrichum kahawae TaxID=34407 RepID=A0AAD9Y0M5_COLKA|nr:hypothetical protein CKAH01_08668 [Colletotrichum kahawae]
MRAVRTSLCLAGSPLEREYQLFWAWCWAGG